MFFQFLILIIAFIVCSFIGTITLFFLYDSFVSSQRRTSKIIKSIKDTDDTKDKFSLRGIEENDRNKLRLFLFQRKFPFHIQEKFYQIKLGTFDLLLVQEELTITKPPVKSKKAQVLPFRRP